MKQQPRVSSAIIPHGKLAESHRVFNAIKSHSSSQLPHSFQVRQPNIGIDPYLQTVNSNFQIMQKIGRTERPQSRSLKSIFARQQDKNIAVNMGTSSLRLDKKLAQPNNITIYSTERQEVPPTTDTDGRQTRNQRGQRSNSDTALEEWQHVFNLQQNRWKEEFDDMKVRNPTELEKDSVLLQRKPRTPFKVPDEYLPLDKRSVRIGQDGSVERLRRDRIIARKIRKKKSAEGEKETSDEFQPLQSKQTLNIRLEEQKKHKSISMRLQDVVHRTVSVPHHKIPEVNLILRQSNKFEPHRHSEMQIATTSAELVEDFQYPRRNSNEKSQSLFYNLEKQLKLPTLYKKNLKKLRKRMVASKLQTQVTNDKVKLIQAPQSSLENSWHQSSTDQIVLPANFLDNQSSSLDRCITPSKSEINTILTQKSIIVVNQQSTVDAISEEFDDVELCGSFKNSKLQQPVQKGYLKCSSLPQFQTTVEKKLKSCQIRDSRKKRLEPLKMANQLLSIVQNDDVTPVQKNISMPLSLQEKMKDQRQQINLVKKFAQKHVGKIEEDSSLKEKLIKSLDIVHSILAKQGLTLTEVTSKLLAELQTRGVEKMIINEPHKILRKNRDHTLQQRSIQGFDFVRILENSLSLRPLLKYQRKLQEQMKRRHMKLMAATIYGDGESDAQAQFKNKQEASIISFIDQVKRLIFLHDQRVADKMAEGCASDFDWVEDPQMYQSSSGESKYSNEDDQEKDHLALGEDALANAMMKYKNADKIIQINEVQKKGHVTSHLVHYLHEMNKSGHIPKGFGFVHRKHSVGTFDGSNCRITDEHAQAMSASLDRAKYVHKLILRNTGLTDSQGVGIIRAMDKTLIRHLDISYNPQLTMKFYQRLVEVLEDPLCLIERLEIEGNKISDGTISEIVRSLTQVKRIAYLNVSHNMIGDQGARDLAHLIQECPRLRLLFMHYNKVMGHGGNEIAAAIGLSKNLQVFDISWNSICSAGLTKKKAELTEQDVNHAAKKKKKKKKKQQVKSSKGFSDLFAQGFSEQWSAAFRQNNSLLHVDISHNHLEQTDVEIIAEGLKDNQQILGIHFAGNEGDIDTQGFVRACKPLSVAQGQVLTRLPTTDQIKLGVVHDQRMIDLNENTNCWICEGWTEHRFTYQPGRSDDNPDHDEFKPIKVHLDIDHYDGDLMIKASMSGEKTYEVFRMLPPGLHRYFYSIDGEPNVAKDQSCTREKVEKIDRKANLDMSKLDIEKICANVKNLPPKKKISTTHLWFAPKRAKQKVEPEKKQIEDYNELDLPQVNYIENIYQTRTILSKDQQATRKQSERHQPKWHPVGRIEGVIEKMNCVPRPGPKGFANRRKVRTPWDFSLSVFASYKADTTKLLNDCFEKDWSRTKVNKIVKNEEELEKFKAYCRSIYWHFREVYKYVAGSDPMGDIFCIGVNVFSDIFTTGMPKFVDGKYLKLTDLDLERIKSNANEQNSKFNPKNNLVRHNFLEVFIRLCDQKYLRNQAAGPDVKTISEAFKLMFDKELLPYFSQFDSQAWRKKVLWREEIDFTLKLSLDPLRAIYKRFIGKNALPGAQQYMSLSELTDCIVNSSCLSENIGTKQIGNMYNLAMMTQVDEIEKDKHINMVFVEFLEAVVRVAEKTDIPHCVIDEFTWGVDDIAPEMRDSYSKQDLVHKLEALIMFLIRGNLPYSFYTKYLGCLKENKGAGLYANDLEPGMMNLSMKRS